ncbi:phage holin family protein [Flavobacterium limnophilum]|uniref:phage holin family protein n=1 Tax=Flavobacterium limnophilum TaxID=3003262 RepID=UPI0022AC70D6|nr:phage holin family protein [Flavobacterium limnophilum]
MKLLTRILLTSVLVLLIAHFMKGVHVAGFVTALLVAVVLGLLNIFIKPIFVLLTLPFTIVTLGLFLLVINAIIILLCTNIVGGFSVDTFWTALLFSVVLSLSQSILFAIVGKD